MQIEACIFTSNYLIDCNYFFNLGSNKSHSNFKLQAEKKIGLEVLIYASGGIGDNRSRDSACAENRIE